MADVTKTIEIIFGGKNDITRAINEIEGSFGQFDTAIHGVTEPLADLHDKILLVEAGVVALGVTLAGAAVNAAGQFGDSVNEIGTLFGGTSAELEKFKQDIFEFASGSSSSIADINKAVYSAISAGVDYRESLDLLNVTEKLSIAGRADLTASTLAVVNVLNSYGLETSKAQEVSDALFTTVRLGQTTLPELANSLSQVTGIAASAGVPFDTVTAALAALTASGLPTTQAITGLKAELSNIIKPASEAEKAAAELKIEFGASALATEGLEGLLKKLYVATGGNVEQMARFFGSVEGLNAALILSRDVSGKFNEALDAMAEKTGATKDAYDLMAENFALINQRLLNNLESTLIAIGTPLLQQYGDIANALGQIFKTMADSVNAGAFNDVFNAIKQAAAALVDYLKGIAAALPEALSGLDFSKLIQSFEDLGLSIGGIFGNLDLTEPEDLRRVIQGIIDAISLLTEVTAKIIEDWQPLIARVVDLVKAFRDGKIDLDAFAASLSLSKQFELLSGALDTAISAIKSIAAGIAVVVAASGFPLLKTVVEGASAAASSLGLGMTGMLPGFAAVAGAATGVAYAVLTNAEAYKDLVARQQAATDSQNQQLFIVQKLQEKYPEAGITLENYKEKLKELVTAADESQEADARRAKALAEVGSALTEAAKEEERAAEFVRTHGEAVDDASGLIETYGENLVITAGKFDPVATAANILAGKMGELGDATEQTGFKFDPVTGAIDKSADAMNRSADAADKLTAPLKAIEKTYEGAGNSGLTFVGVVENGVIAYERLTGGLEKAKPAHDEITKATDKLTEAEKIAIQNAHDFAIKMEELASNERIKAMEFAVDLQITGLEEGTKRLEIFSTNIADMFEDVSATIAPLAELLTTQISDKSPIFKAIKEIIDVQLEIERDLADAQIRNFDAQSALANAQLEALINSGGEITWKVEAAGLQPHLEAVLRALLDGIRIQVAADQAAFLVGAGFQPTAEAA